MEWAELNELKSWRKGLVCVCVVKLQKDTAIRDAALSRGDGKKKVTVTFLCPLALRSAIITSYWLNSTRSQPAGVPTEAKHIHQSSSSQGKVEKHENISGG